MIDKGNMPSACQDKCYCNSDGKCRHSSDNTCECPCVFNVNYDICTNTYNPNKAPICAFVRNNHHDGPPARVRNLTSLNPPKCYPTNGCSNTTAELSCRKYRDCSWCEKRRSGKVILWNPFCSTNDQCFGGMAGKPSPFLDPLPPKDIDNENLEASLSELDLIMKSSKAVTALVSCVILFIVFVVLLWFLIKRLKEKRSEASAQNEAGVHQYFQEGMGADVYNEDGFNSYMGEGYNAGGYNQNMYPDEYYPAQGAAYPAPPNADYGFEEDDDF